MKLIVWLGNPGKNYEKTRHNIWFSFLDRWNEREQLGSWKFVAKFQGEIIQTERAGEKIILAKPQTFMNNSGNVVAPLARFYQIESQDILVLHDEIDFPTAKIALKYWGGVAGHNGLKSIVAKLGTKDFWRLRIGIDRPLEQAQVTNRVLGKFKTEEIEALTAQESTIFALIQDFIQGVSK